jgi:hypothetical protein
MEKVHCVHFPRSTPGRPAGILTGNFLFGSLIQCNSNSRVRAVKGAVSRGCRDRRITPYTIRNKALYFEDGLLDESLHTLSKIKRLSLSVYMTCFTMSYSCHIRCIFSYISLYRYYIFYLHGFLIYLPIYLTKYSTSR